MKLCKACGSVAKVVEKPGIVVPKYKVAMCPRVRCENPSVWVNAECKDAGMLVRTDWDACN